jgi:UDP-N-acetylmuramate: L-alanyl-gamma-D-glutamyl-meso-diaminopimelate ligase
VIGNVIRKDNPEAQAAIQQKLRYLSMSDAIAELFLKDKHSVVVTGTHGKTTMSSLMSWLLEHAGRSPSFMIGGIPLNFGSGARLSNGAEFVLEGDEYDTAFFDKTPKFLHYHAKSAILGAVEFDHADIYKDLDHVMQAFTQFVKTLPQDGLLVAYADHPNTRKLLQHAACRVVTYGIALDADYHLDRMTSDTQGSHFVIVHNDEQYPFDSPLYGEHNALNALACVALAREHGVPWEILQEGVRTFAGVKRRMEVIGVVKEVTIIDDFAHHPTAVRETIRGLRCKYPEQRLVVVFEPRSNTTRRKIFQNEFVEAFRGASRVLLAPVARASELSVSERLDPEALSQTLMNAGIESYALSSYEYLLEFLMRNAEMDDVIVFMSNGDFGGLHHKLLEKIQRKRLIRGEGSMTKAVSFTRS